MLSYGVRSKCCYSPVRLARKKLKSGRTVQIWVCLRCKKRDVDLVEYTDKQATGSSHVIGETSKFIVDEERSDDE
jgi:hypothetical protein